MCEARSLMGYYSPKNKNLMWSIAGKPYMMQG